jgi:hypothetical protein
MVLLVVFLAFLLGVALVMGGYTAVTRLPQALEQRRLDRRLMELSAPPDADEAPAESRGIVKALHVGTLPAFDKLMGNTTRGSALSLWIDQSGVQASLSGVFLIAVGLAVLMAFVAGAALGSKWGWPIRRRTSSSAWSSCRGSPMARPTCACARVRRSPGARAK